MTKNRLKLKEEEAAFHAAEADVQGEEFMDAQPDRPPPHPDFDYRAMHDSFINYVDLSIDRVNTRLDHMEQNILDSQIAMEQRMMDAFATPSFLTRVIKK
ncbi:hypothetical protein RIF29_09020 [Crotalaria pallida]|uniref:Uncharacterized protein n=1 Tax=Crotalaria pallida TaxID=3830 RepID=A0AAN9ILL3_CROPI